MSEQKIDCLMMDEHRKKFKLGTPPTYLTIRKWPLEYLRLEFFNERKLGGDRLLLKRTKRGNETGVKLRATDVEKIASIFRKQYEGNKDEKYVRGDRGVNNIQSGHGVWKKWMFEPIIEIPGENPNKKICFKLMYSPSLPGEWYFLIEETLSLQTGEWTGPGGVEIPWKNLGEIAEIFEEYVPCMKK